MLLENNLSKVELEGVIKAKIEGEKFICYIKFFLVAFLTVMIFMASLGFARSDFWIIFAEAVAAFISLSSSLFLLRYLKKGRYPDYLGYIISTLDVIVIILPYLTYSIGYPVVSFTTSIPWLFPIFIIATSQRFSFKNSLYTAILAFVFYLAISVIIGNPLFMTKFTYPDGTAQYDRIGRLLLLNDRGEGFNISFSILDPFIKSMTILLSGVIAGKIGERMKKKIIDSLKLAEIQKDMRLKFKDSIQLSVESSTKTSEAISTSFSQISASTSEMITTLKNIGNNAIEQAKAVENSVKNIDVILHSLESIETFVNEQFKLIQNASLRSIKLSEGIKTVLDLSSKTNSSLSSLVELTKVGQEAIEESILALERISTTSNDILKMNKDINDISENTNVLSINASIEAANVGQYGTGFTVLANQIRNLSYQTNTATNKINASIEEISKRIKESINSSEKVASVFNKIKDSTIVSDKEVAQITNTTKDQYDGTKEIDTSMEQIVEKMNEIITMLENEKTETERIYNQINKIKELASITSESIQQQIIVGEEILNSTVSVSSIVEENKELSNNMNQILESNEKE